MLTIKYLEQFSWTPLTSHKLIRSCIINKVRFWGGCMENIHSYQRSEIILKNPTCIYKVCWWKVYNSSKVYVWPNELMHVCLAANWLFEKHIIIHDGILQSVDEILSNLNHWSKWQLIIHTQWGVTSSVI